jgi:hypothetical protein
MLMGTPAPAWRRSMSVTVPLGVPKTWMFVVASMVSAYALAAALGDQFHVEDH